MKKQEQTLEESNSVLTEVENVVTEEYTKPINNGPSMELEVVESMGDSNKKLIDRAKAVNYTPRLPKAPRALPEDETKWNGHEASLMRGYRKRLKNWVRGLVKIEDYFGKAENPFTVERVEELVIEEGVYNG